MTLRKCQPCTACCEGHLELGDDLQVSKETGACTHCINSACNIYVSRPKHPCQSFECLWLMDKSPLPNWMRPDQSRVIIALNKIKNTDHIALVALQMDEKIPQRTLKWLKKYTAKYKIYLALIDNQQVKVSITNKRSFDN